MGQLKHEKKGLENRRKWIFRQIYCVCIVFPTIRYTQLDTISPHLLASRFFNFLSFDKHIILHIFLTSSIYGLCFRFTVSYCPTLPEDSEMITFLQALGISWPKAPANLTNEEREEKIQEALENSSYREQETEGGRRSSRGGGGRKGEEGEKEGSLRVNLKRVFQEEGLLGYDPSLGTCTG